MGVGLACDPICSRDSNRICCLCAALFAFLAVCNDSTAYIFLQPHGCLQCQYREVGQVDTDFTAQDNIPFVPTEASLFPDAGFTSGQALPGCVPPAQIVSFCTVFISMELGMGAVLLL
jgi:hypothetical protein